MRELTFDTALEGPQIAKEQAIRAANLRVGDQEGYVSDRAMGGWFELNMLSLQQ